MPRGVLSGGRRRLVSAAELAKWAAVALLSAGVGAYLVWQALQLADVEPSIADYCAYSAVSMAQLRGCEAHVTTAQIKLLHSDAADFAHGEAGLVPG